MHKKKPRAWQPPSGGICKWPVPICDPLDTSVMHDWSEEARRLVVFGIFWRMEVPAAWSDLGH